MDYNYTILDQVKFGDQIKDNKLSNLKEGNPIIIKALNGSEHWVHINKENDLTFMPIEFLGLNELKPFGIKEEEFNKLKNGDDVELKINGEDYLFNIDLKEESGISLKRVIEIGENFDLEKLRVTEPELYEILNSYEKLPFGEFSYNHLNEIQNESKSVGYNVEFDLGAEISSITKQLTLQEIPSLIEDLKYCAVVYFTENEKYKIIDQLEIDEHLINLNESDYVFLKEYLVDKKEIIKQIDLYELKEVIDHGRQRKIDSFLNSNEEDKKNSLYFLDKVDSKIYQVENIRNDGKVYFKEVKNSDTTFNYFDGIPMNLENIKNGKLDQLHFFGPDGNYIKDVNSYLFSTKQKEDIQKLINQSKENNFFQFHPENHFDLNATGGKLELADISRLKDYMPDVIEGYKLISYDKEELLKTSILNNYQEFGLAVTVDLDNGNCKEYRFNKDRILIANEYSTKNDIIDKKVNSYIVDFNSLNFNINNQISNQMAENVPSANNIDVKGAKTAEDKPVITYKAGDPVLVKEGNVSLVGIVKENKDGNLTIDVKNNKEIKETTVNSKDAEPLFYVNKEDQKVWVKFAYSEVSRAINNTDGVKVKLEANQIMGLMAGEKSKVMPYQVDIDGKMANVEGRVFLRRNADGNPYVAHDVKHKELNLDLPVYGVKLNDEQKQMLTEKGELGLVSGFKSGEKDFSLWVGLDKGLNKVVTKRENDVYIDKVFGVQLNDTEKAELKKGNGIHLKEKDLFIRVNAAGSSSNSLGVYKTEKAIELGLMKKPEEEKKNSRGTGMKM